MLQELSGPPANPSSVHAFGQRARALLIEAREKVAKFFHVRPEEIIFTSGGTEAINYFLKGLKGHVVTTEIEHSAIFNTLQNSGLRVSFVPVGLWGAPLATKIEEAITDQTTAIVLSASNSETGVKIDLNAIAKLAIKRNIPLFIDAVSYIGKERLVIQPGVSALALSAHKFHGPKGVGALYLSSQVKMLPQMTGGAQENQRRAGTENLSGILGLAKALEILEFESGNLLHLRLHLEKGLSEMIPDIAMNGLGPRISNTSNIAFLGVDGEALLMQLDLAGIAVSHGSACSSGSLEPSRVLINMGIDRKIARSSLRFSLSRMNTKEEIDRTIEITAQIVKNLRKVLA